MKNTYWKVTWKLAKRETKSKRIIEAKIIESIHETKLKALDRYFFMMYGLPEKERHDVSELKIFKNEVDVTEKINSWLFSDRVS